MITLELLGRENQKEALGIDREDISQTGRAHVELQSQR